MDNEKRTQSILDQIVPTIHLHKSANQRPFILGLTGLQGSGKSFLASALADLLRNKYELNVIEVSLDDFYLPHEEQLALRKQHPSYDLLQNRGQPSTHDTDLAQAFFKQLASDPQSKEPIWIPSFDKSRFSGDGDRVPRSEWRFVPRDRPLDVVIFEGWCVGFRPLADEEVLSKWSKARTLQSSENQTSQDVAQQGIESQFSTLTLADHEVEELLFINENLQSYCADFMGPQHFDFMVHLDTNDLVNVYTWRMQQEHALKGSRGTGMTDQQVVNFVQRYMPAYELYLEHLRLGFFRGDASSAKESAHLHVLLDVKRGVTELQIVSNSAQ